MNRPTSRACLLVAALLVVLAGAEPGKSQATRQTATAVSQASDGTLTLAAVDATLTGHCTIGFVCGTAAVTNWDNPADTVSWDAALNNIPETGATFEVMLTYAAAPDSAGNEFEIQVGGQRVTGKTEATGGSGGWAQFNSVAVGAVRIAKAGPLKVAVKCAQLHGADVMDLRAVILRRATEQEIQKRITQSHPTGPYAKAGDAPPLVISVDVADVPAWEDWGLQIREYLRKWYPVIDRRLHTDGFTPPRVFGVRVIKAIDAVGRDSAGRPFEVTAFANQYGTLVASQKWARPDNHGMMVHEMTHIIQAYPPAEHWVREGVADFIRYYVVEPGSPHAVFDHATADYRQGYQATSAFLNWIEMNYGRGPHGSIISRLNDALRHGSYTSSFFKRATGKDVDELWAEFKMTL